jgi:hypothetical protein
MFNTKKSKIITSSRFGIQKKMTYLFRLHVHLSGLEARCHMLLRLSAIPNSCQIVAITQIVQKTGIHHAREMLGCVQQQKICTVI